MRSKCGVSRDGSSDPMRTSILGKQRTADPMRTSILGKQRTADPMRSGERMYGTWVVRVAGESEGTGISPLYFEG